MLGNALEHAIADLKANNRIAFERYPYQVLGMAIANSGAGRAGGRSWLLPRYRRRPGS